MKRYSGKRGAPVALPPKKGNSVDFKNTPTDEDQNHTFCNRIGCSGRIKYSQNLNTQIGSSKKVKSPKPSFSSSNWTEMPSQSESTEMVLHSPSRNLARHHLGLNSSLPSNVTSQKTFRQKPKPSNLKTSSISTKNNSNNSSRGGCSSSLSTSTGSSMHGLRNLKCNSVSNNVSLSSSSSGSKSSGKNILKKKIPEGGRQRPYLSGISITSSGRSNSVSGDSNKTAGSVRTRRPMNTSNVRTRPNVGGGPQSSDSVNIGRPWFSAGGASSSYSPLSSNPDGEADFAWLMNHECYNMNGLSELLLALERIRQEEELTHEQVLDLENNLFINGLNLSDQHRDMRLDIDNMSYEELLALEEKMGSVSMALSDETLLKCIKRGIYDVGPPEIRVTGSGEYGNEITCSICQEEYVVGDETGQLVGCQHEYHLTCINQWLQLKNWCPICKASVAAAQQESE